MRKLILAVGIIFLVSSTTPAVAGLIGTKCSNSGAKISDQGVDYICKNVSGRLKWQKAPEVRSEKARTDCLMRMGWDPGPDANPQRNINISNYCREKFGPK